MNFFDDNTEEKVSNEKEQRLNHTLWVERYRPVQLDTFIGNELVKEKAAEYISKNDLPHLLFHGRAGGGKTTLAKILATNLNCDVKYINASDENSIDDVRTKVKGFASTTGFKDLKIMILDECLDENTLVWILRDGKEMSIAIKNLDTNNDLVKSYNIEKSEIQYRPFDLHYIGQSEVYELELENGEKAICTDTHKWYVENENGDIILVKTKDIINGKYDYILTK